MTNETIVLSNVMVDAFKNIIRPALGVSPKLSLSLDLSTKQVRSYATEDASFVKALHGNIDDFAIIDTPSTNTILMFVWDGNNLLNTLSLCGQGCKMEIMTTVNRDYGMLEATQIILTNVDGSLVVRYGCAMLGLGYVHYDTAKVKEYASDGSNPISFDLSKELLAKLLQLGNLNTLSQKSYIELFTKNNALYSQNANFEYKVLDNVGFTLDSAKIAIDSLRRIDKGDFKATISNVLDKGISKMVVKNEDSSLIISFVLASSVTTDGQYQAIVDNIDDELHAFFPEDDM